MPLTLPHERFSKYFRTAVNKWLYRARSRAERKEVWAIMHFDQHEDSVETFHSHSGMQTKVYKEQLDRLHQQNPGPANYNFNWQVAEYRARHIMQGLPEVAQQYADMHAEEELIQALPGIYNDWISRHGQPKYCIIYLNFSPCLTSGAKTINGDAYPTGCLYKLVQFARLYKEELLFAVYFDQNFGQPTVEAYNQALANVAHEGFILFAPMPSELRTKDPAALGRPALFSGLLPTDPSH